MSRRAAPSPIASCAFLEQVHQHLLDLIAIEKDRRKRFLGVHRKRDPARLELRRPEHEQLAHQLREIARPGFGVGQTHDVGESVGEDAEALEPLDGDTDRIQEHLLIAAAKRPARRRAASRGASPRRRPSC
jgi:hypothetical protein